MKNFDLKEWRHGHCVNRVEAVEALKPIFPGMDTDLMAKAEEPYTYGVQLIKEAEAVLRAHYRLRPSVGKDGLPRDSSGHKYTERMLVRMPIEMKLQLKGMIREMGYETMQDYLYDLLLEELDSYRKDRLVEDLGVEGRMFYGLD